MEKQSVLEIVTRSRLVAIVRMDDLQNAVELVQAMLNGGVRAIEFTLTNSDTPDVVRSMLDKFEQFHNGLATLGIGSVRSAEEAQLAIDSGAQFLVSPITLVEIIDKAKSAGVACMPGAYTPTEIAAAHTAGADIIKVFPVKSLGPSYIKDLLAPMPYLKLMPTGGVDLRNMEAYFAAGAVAVGMGSQLISPSAVAACDWEFIQAASNAHAKAARLS